MFFTARFHPSDDKQNVIMGGCADKKIYQWDSDTGDLVQACSCTPLIAQTPGSTAHVGIHLVHYYPHYQATTA